MEALGFASRVHAIQADFETQHLGLSPEPWASLATKVRVVINLACDTSYSKTYAQMREAWVVNLVRLCEWCAQHAIQLHHLGGVGGLVFQDPEDFHMPYTW